LISATDFIILQRYGLWVPPRVAYQWTSFSATGNVTDTTDPMAPRRRPAPTISQVAAAAGVSRATVSRAFTRPEMLSEETVRHVRTTADALGYVPNQVARALSTGRHGNLALIVPDVTNPFFPPLIRAAQRRAEEAGFCVFLGNSDEMPEREDTLVSRFSGQVEGIILASPRMHADHIRMHAERRPLVLINRDVAGISRVLINSAQGIAAAIAHLYELGHRRIVYVSGPSASWSNQQRQRAIGREAKARRIGVTTIPARLPSYESGRAAATQIGSTGATAAIAFDDLIAQGLIAGLSERGVEVPAQFSVIGCDDVLGTTTYPPLTTVAARCSDAGEAAADLLIKLMQAGAPSEVRCILGSHLAVRATTAPAPRR
jgi:LacI family transcriptional regulator